MSHDHGELHLDQGEARRARRILLAITLPLLIGTLVGMAVLWPRGDTPVGSQPNPVDGPNFAVATVVEVTGEVGEEIRAELQDGSGDVVPVQVAPEIMAGGIDPGDEIRVFFTASAMGSGSPYVFVDFVRNVPLVLLAVVYALLVLAVARWRGLMAIGGLLLSLAVVVVFLVPALMSGGPPLPVTLVGASAMMFVAVYLAHGVSIRTTTALLGTFVGLAVTTLLAGWSTNAAELSGGSTDASIMLNTMLPGVGLRELLLCGIVIAGLGALNDVTITQASAVWELHAASPTTSRARVFARAMRIGRDHIASTVYTLAFAYVGTALPTLMIVMLYDRSLSSTLTAGEIAEEVVRTLVSSIGLVLAIPATTALAAVLVRTAPGKHQESVKAGSPPETSNP
ncbi:YibE/F family protein [Ruania halotolerans]|uniref:YibE/F family protein n=1 Tax=Ruania halotolerans TaxID=2897773 RepID=UPI001E5FEBDD|nr:YibE/F family protein [Ruania halotolerans]UFU04913.1 YibE/F family protein [Ruania halotolerans]